MNSGLKQAISFLTILPVANNHKDLSYNNLLGYFPLVGLLLGACLAISNYIFGILKLPTLLSSSLILCIWIGLTGALHLDGFCDTVDGLSGGKNSDEIMRIMQDSSIGPKAAVALFLLLGLKLFSIEGLSLNTKDNLLLAIPSISRWAMVYICYISPPIDKGMGNRFISAIGLSGLLRATIAVLIIAGFILKGQCILFFIIAIGYSYLLKLYFSSRVGGISGDILGFANETLEVIILLAGVIISNQ